MARVEQLTEEFLLAYARVTEARELRLSVKLELMRLGLIPEEPYHVTGQKDSNASKLLMELFNYDNYAAFCSASHSDKDVIRKLKLLTGPHAYVVFKAMKAKR